jgi:hypothetical protein
MGRVSIDHLARNGGSLDTTVTHLIAMFRDAIRALVPIMDRAHITWKEHEAYDQWDAIVSVLYERLVIEPIRWGLGDGEVPLAEEILRLPRYDFFVDDYSNRSFIELTPSQRSQRFPNAFLRFVSDSDPFDLAEVVMLDEARIIRSPRPPRRLRLANARFDLMYRAEDGQLERIANLQVPD